MRQKSQAHRRACPAETAIGSLAGLFDSCPSGRALRGRIAYLNIEITLMSAMWVPYKPCNHALWFDSRTFNRSSACSADVDSN
jgi:hypothetical protein